jgi:hypothetical protein
VLIARASRLSKPRPFGEAFTLTPSLPAAIASAAFTSRR